MKIFYLRVRVDHVDHVLLLNFVGLVRFQSVLKFIKHGFDTVRVVLFVFILQNSPDLFSYFLMILLELLVLLFQALGDINQSGFFSFLISLPHLIAEIGEFIQRRNQGGQLSGVDGQVEHFLLFA